MIVTCNFVGRCGNQLFQIAATLGYAMRHGKKMGFPSKSVAPQHWPMYFNNLPRYRGGGCKTWKQPDDGLYHEIPSFSGDVRLMGFFQSEKYFSNSEEFRQKFYPLIDYQPQPLFDACAIHVRRTDYIEHAASFPPLPLTYYQKAIERMRAVGVESFTVFSDDPDYCSQYFQGMTIIRDQPPVKDLFHMSSFKYIIAANSSFSWWGAWLNEQDKTVIVPAKEQYYGSANPTKTDDLFPERWTQLTF